MPALITYTLSECRPSLRKLDEALFYDGPRFRLKLARYYENLPLHYTGEIFVVQCASANTQNAPEGKTNDLGWVVIDRGGAIGSRSAQEVIERVRQNYTVIDERMLAWSTVVLNIHFDGCGSLARWDPTTLPEELIDPVEKPDYCAPKGSADCRSYDFQGDRAPRYREIHATPEGVVSFTVQSKGFKRGATLRVSSNDFGKSWQWERTEAVDDNRDGSSYRPGSA